MNFTVRFTTDGTGEENRSFYNRPIEIGTRILKELEIASGTALDYLEPFTCPQNGDVEIVISPEEAFKLDLFENSNQVWVKVKKQSLSEYSKFELDTTTHSEKNFVDEVPDQETIYALWKEAGYPLEWDVPQPEEDVEEQE
jgi:hypothetical protein